MPRRKFPCTVCACNCNETENSIQCFQCANWIHRRCVPMDYDMLTEWGADGLMFVCRPCAFHAESGFYRTEDAIERLASANPEQAQIQAKSEQLLLQTYGIVLPPRKHLQYSSDMSCDKVSQRVLEHYHPVMLDTHVPVQTRGDGNCLFRSLSLGLFETEDHHILIRLLTAIEMMLHREHYDTDHAQYVDKFHDDRLIFDKYDKMMCDVARLGGYCDLLPACAASAALGVSFYSYCPPTSDAYFLSDPLSRLVKGRGVSGKKSPGCTIMWTVSTFNKKDPVTSFRPNHFVVLVDKRPAVAAVIVDDDVKDTDAAVVVDDADVKDADAAASDDIVCSTCILSSASDEDDSVDDNDEHCDDTDPNVAHDDDDDDDSDAHNNAADQTILPHGKFLNIDNLLDALKKTPLSEALEKVPNGKKDNVYFVVNNSDNLQRRQQGQNSIFHDDRGAWGRGPTNKTLFVQKDGKIQKVVNKGENYCLERTKSNKTTYTPLTPQPLTEEILTLHRYYVKHTGDETYQKRVSWLSNEFKLSSIPPIAIYEFKGTCPLPKPHGRTTTGNCGSYVRLHPKVMQKMKDKLKTQKPAEVYTECDLEDGPRNKKQVYNAKVREEKKNDRGTNINFSDQLASVEEVQHSYPFIQQIIRTHGKTASIILYSKEQITDLGRFCCPPLTAQSTVLCVDKTYCLGDVHVTVTCYKNLALTRRGTGDHPLFFGPMYLHGNSDFDSFFIFFHHLAGRLQAYPQSPTLGSDEERALQNAIRTAFPNSQLLVCTRHLRNNFQANLADKVGIPVNQRKQITECLFGKKGIVASATDPIEFEDHADFVAQSLPKEARRYVSRILPFLKENINATLKPGLLVESPMWTNNNSESLNHVLKQTVHWKSQKLVQLIQKLENVVKNQFREAKRSLFGAGDYILCGHFRKFFIERDTWFQMSVERKTQHFVRFINTTNDINVVRSTDGLKTTLAPKHMGKKPSQRKRKMNAKTNSAPKRMKNKKTIV